MRRGGGPLGGLRVVVRERAGSGSPGRLRLGRSAAAGACVALPAWFSPVGCVSAGLLGGAGRGGGGGKAALSSRCAAKQVGDTARNAVTEHFSAAGRDNALVGSAPFPPHTPPRNGFPQGAPRSPGGTPRKAAGRRCATVASCLGIGVEKYNCGYMFAK